MDGLSVIKTRVGLRTIGQQKEEGEAVVRGVIKDYRDDRVYSLRISFSENINYPHPIPTQPPINIINAHITILNF